jgi:hypothetical protein
MNTTSLMARVGSGGARFAGPSPARVERRERPFDPMPRPTSPSEEERGPRRPEAGSPDKDNLLKRMRKVDPKQAERYRQRTGE